MTGSGFKVAILDPLPAFRDHLQSVFTAEGYQVCDWPDAITDRTKAPNVALVFLESSHRAIERLTSSLNTTIVGTTDKISIDTLQRAYKLDCQGLVLRSSSPTSIAAAVFLAGHGYRVALNLESTHGSLAEAEVPDTTEIEVKILCGLASGSSVSELSQHLNYSRRQIHRYMAHLCQRLGVTTTTQAVALAARWGFIS